MFANVGDHIHVWARHVGGPVRHGTITEVRGTNGAPPYFVRWKDTDTPALVFPGPDAQVRPAREGKASLLGHER
jgi:hypothetical protein